ncbi:hypothetical protein FKM82_028189 [Ascaphus truei]
MGNKDVWGNYKAKYEIRGPRKGIEGYMGLFVGSIKGQDGVRLCRGREEEEEDLQGLGDTEKQDNKRRRGRKDEEGREEGGGRSGDGKGGGDRRGGERGGDRRGGEKT